MKGAAEQLADLQRAVLALPQGGGLAGAVRSVIRSLGNTAKTCKLIDQLEGQLGGSLGKKLTADQRNWLLGELARISDVLGCATKP